MNPEGPRPADIGRRPKSNAKARVIRKSVLFDQITLRRLGKLAHRQDSSFSNIAYQAIQRGLPALEAERATA